MKSFNSNVQALKSASAAGSVTMLGIDPIKAIEMTQNQFESLSKEIVRSSNVGIGYAFELDEIHKCLN